MSVFPRRQPRAPGPRAPGCNIPSSSSFSSRLASLRSLRSCLSISPLILLDSLASSLRQHAAAASRAIATSAANALNWRNRWDAAAVCCSLTFWVGVELSHLQQVSQRIAQSSQLKDRLSLKDQKVPIDLPKIQNRPFGLIVPDKNSCLVKLSRQPWLSN